MRNFESTKSTKPRRDDAAQEAFVARKGKRNKPLREGRVDWETTEDIRQRPDDARRGGAL